MNQQSNQKSGGVLGEERKLGGGQSTPLSTLPSRHSVKPSSPDYDRVVLEHMKRKVEIDPVAGCWLWQGFGLRMGWSEEEALSTPPIPQGEQTPRRVLGVRNRGAQS